MISLCTAPHRRLATGVLLTLAGAIAGGFAAAGTAHAQQAPTPAQARVLLETRPDLVRQLRQEIANSGLTPDQIRARLRAAGYPEDLLDAYVGPRRTGPDSLAALPVNDGLLDAVAALGIVDSTGTSELRDMLRGRRTTASATARATDSLTRASDRRRIIDSLASLDSLGTLDSLSQFGTVDAQGRIVRRTPFPRSRALTAPDTGGTIFGLSVFESATSQFDPNLSGPVDANYRIGPGDQLVLLITGDAEHGYTLEVTRDGSIVIPGVGQLAVANLTLGQVEQLLYPALGRVYSGLRRDASATTKFSLTVARLHTNQVFVLGDVEHPGSYRVSSAGTALSALYAAAGPTKNGSLRHVEIRRGGKLVDSLDLYDYLLRGDASHDVRLQSGDIVFVPVHGPRVRLYGEVVRPSTYELRKGESLADLLRQGGGFNAEAARRRVQISRILPPTQRDTTDRARVLVDVGSEQFATGFGPAYPLEPGDVVRVLAVSEQVSRRVAVRGAVWTPGPIGLTTGMRLSDAIALAGGLKPDAYLAQVLVSRLRPTEAAREQLRAVIQPATGRPVDDIVLREDDEVRVFAVSEFRAPVYVAITGAVRHAGRYAYTQGMTLRDLVLLAGGLEARASLTGAELARLPATRDGAQLAVTQPIRLDSSYVVTSSASARIAGTANRDAEIALQPFDNVLIVPQSDGERPRQVIVTGEVRYPGTYTLTGKSDRLRDVITRAGGLTTAAYAGGVRFIRQAERLGRIGVDLPRVMRDASDKDNLLLQDRDSVLIPAYSGIVEVQGAVGAPRGVAYMPGATLDDYVRAAGGPTRNAEPERAYVTQADGRVESVERKRWWPDTHPVPRAGSVVFVPEKDPTSRTSDTLARLGIIAQILGSLTAIVAIARR